MAITEIAYNSHEEWLELRKGFIGGSDAGAVMGMNPYSSPFAVWAEKTGKVEGFAGNLTTKVGAYLEDLVAQLFTEETGKKVRRKNRMLINTDYPFACADVDRLVVGEKALLEIKTTNSFPAMKKIRGGEYPEMWYCQMVHYLAVTGLEKAYLAVLVNCRDLQIFELERDEDEITALMDAERLFWEKVMQDIPPEADGSEATSEALAAMFPHECEETMILFDANHLLEARSHLLIQKKGLETELDRINNEIKAQMQEAERAVCGRWTCAWKSQSRKTLDRKALEQDYPGIDLDKYYKTSTTRVFRVTEKKEDKAS